MVISLPSCTQTLELKFHAQYSMVVDAADELTVALTPSEVMQFARAPVSSTVKRHSTALLFPASPATVNESASTAFTSS